MTTIPRPFDPVAYKSATRAQWEAAADQCHRQGIAEVRNQQTAELFRQAAA